MILKKKLFAVFSLFVCECCVCVCRRRHCCHLFLQLWWHYSHGDTNIFAFNEMIICISKSKECVFRVFQTILTLSSILLWLVYDRKKTYRRSYCCIYKIQHIILFICVMYRIDKYNSPQKNWNESHAHKHIHMPMCTCSRIKYKHLLLHIFLFFSYEFFFNF